MFHQGLIVLHELTHPDFSLHTNNEPDKPNGELHADWALWDAAASRSVSGGKAQKSKFKEFSSKNAASYAWYSVSAYADCTRIILLMLAVKMYNYMNLVDGCQGVHWDNGIVSYTASQCATDIWPQDREKYVKNSWTEWA
jgi:hypothetical protein